MNHSVLDPDFEPRIADWLENDPDRAPDAVLETVLAAFPSIPQRRAVRAPWRHIPMNRLALAGASIAAAAVLVVALWALPRPAGPAAQPSIGPTASLPILPDGSYLGVEQEAPAIRSMIQADATLDNAAKTAILDTVLRIRNARTYQTKIDVRGSSMSVSQGVDGAFEPEVWTIARLGDGRMSARWANGTIVFAIQGCDPPTAGCTFELRAVSAAPSAVEAFVRRIVFESGGPFVPAP